MQRSQLTSPVPESNFMEDSNSFHGAITAQEAIKRLQIALGDYYITRFSSANKSYVLSVLKRNPHNSGHFRLVMHYETNRIHPEFDNIGRRLTVQTFTQLSQRRCIIQ